MLVSLWTPFIRVSATFRKEVPWSMFTLRYDSKSCSSPHVSWSVFVNSVDYCEIIGLSMLKDSLISPCRINVGL